MIINKITNAFLLSAKPIRTNNRTLVDNLSCVNKQQLFTSYIAKPQGCYSFSSIKTSNKNNRSYDLITIGPYANRCASILHNKILKNKNKNINILTIQQQPFMYEPKLLPITLNNGKTNKNNNDCIVTLQQNNHEFSDIQKGVKVQSINKDSIKLSTGQDIHYNQLIYSGYPIDWLSSSTNNNSSINKVNASYQYQYIYNQHNISNLTQLLSNISTKLKQNDRVVFIVPDTVNYGYCNYIFMIMQSMCNNRNKINKNIQISIVCEGVGIYPTYSSTTHVDNINKITQQELVQKGIQVYTNTKYKINHNNKTIQIEASESNNIHNSHNSKSKSNNSKNNSQNIIKFNHIINYLPLNTPQLLRNSSIQLCDDVSNTHAMSCRYNNESNIHIIPPYSRINDKNNNNNKCQYQLHSLSQIQIISHIIAYNIMYNIYGIKKQAIYNNKIIKNNKNSIVNIWHDQNDCRKYYINNQNGNVTNADKNNKNKKNIMGSFSKLITNSITSIKYNDTKSRIFNFINKAQSCDKFNIQDSIQHVSIANGQNLDQAISRFYKYKYNPNINNNNAVKSSNQK